MKYLLIIVFAFALVGSATAQNYPKLEKALTAEFSENANKNGHWIFYANQANIEKMEKPLVNAVIPNYEFYGVTLTNYVGDQISQSPCIVLFDSSNSQVILVEPLWLNGVSKPLMKLFVNKRFGSKDQLLAFLDQLNEMMQAGTGCKFVRTGITNEVVTYDLINFKRNPNGAWRKIQIGIEGSQIVRYTSIDPAANQVDHIIK